MFVFHCTTHKQEVKISAYYAIQRFFKLHQQLCLACYTVDKLRNLTLKRMKNPTSFIHHYRNDGDCSRKKPELMGAAYVCVSSVQLNHIKFLHWSLATDSCGALATAATHYFHIMSLHLLIPSALIPSQHLHTPYSKSKRSHTSQYHTQSTFLNALWTAWFPSWDKHTYF